MTRRIGIDLGGTKIDAIALSAAGDVLFENRVTTPKTYDGIVSAIRDLVQAAGDGTVGIGAPGSLSRKTGLWRNANILVCNGRAFKADLETAIGRSIAMDNDANCFALSEAIDGAGQGYSVVAFFTVGTALGGGLVVDGKVVVGANGEAGEFGHTALPWPNESEWPLLPCFCGKLGCAEQYVSGTGLARDHLRVTGEDISGKEIVARARGGDGRALASLARLQDRFARVAANIACVVDPDVFVIGGGLSELPELVEEMQALISRYSFSGTAEAKVLRARHGEKSGVRGAARLWG
jgi:fructokinase